MAAKRLLENGETPEEKRPRESSSLANAIREAVTNMPVENFRRALEPLFRRVVQEELGRSIQQFERVNNSRRNGRLQLQECIEAPKLSLKFKEKLALPIFTSTNIEAQSNNPLELVIIDNQTGNRAQLQGLPPSLKVEILVVDGDFPPGDRESWTAEEFNSNVVRRREGKRPLLAGDVSITLKDGVGLIKLLSLTDNSSWTRSRKFRLGARVVKDKNGGIRIGEALSEAFIVKDHRGESYKKHHPPSLNDEVWRLEKIGKDGAFHQRLAAENINNVQDFLKLSVMDQPRLRMKTFYRNGLYGCTDPVRNLTGFADPRKILGGMSDKMWEVTLAHAKECNLGQKMYVHHDISQSVIVGLNSICEPLTVLFGGLRFPIDGLNEFEKAQVQEVVKDAHQNWHKVKEMDMWPNTNLLPSTSDFNKESAGDSLIPTTSSLQQGTILLEAPDADVGPSFRSNSRIEFQLQDSGNYFPIYNHRVQTPGSTYPSRNLEDQDQLPNFYGHLP